MEPIQEMDNIRPLRKKYPIRKIIRYTVSVLAGLALVVLLVLGYSFYQLSPNKLIRENYTTYQWKGEINPTQKESKIEKAYRENRFADITVIPDSLKRVSDILLNAMAQMELGDNPKAIEGFKKVIAAREPVAYVQDAEYYLSLAYIATSDYDLAQEYLKAIHANPTHAHHEKVTRKLLRQVRLLKWR